MTQKKQHYREAPSNPDLPALEQEILARWKKEGTFQKSVEQRPRQVSGVRFQVSAKEPKKAETRNLKPETSNNEYVFYDGPPFANGLPHYGHLLTSCVKDIDARYRTMKGKRVERRFGWDCHGLPAEMEAEKELGVSGRKAIEDFGIAKFNDHCRTSVMKYTHIWQDYIERAGRWVDFEHDYKTMDKDYMESVLWAFKQLYDKGLIYESHRVMPYSWAAQTPLSNFETRMDDAYREIESKAVTVAFRLKEIPEELRAQSPELREVYLLAWTTTPWTLPSNLALAVNKKLIYKAYLRDNICFIISSNSESRYNDIVWKPGEVLTKEIRGGDLLGLTYEPLFPYFKDHPKSFRILDGSDFIEEGSGTGVVHLAPGFGEDDQRVCAAAGIELVCPVDEAGKFTDEMSGVRCQVPDKEKAETWNLEPGTLNLQGRHVFDTNTDIIKYLKSIGAHIKTEQYKHSYPHCWRTDTPLIYKAVPSWYVEVTKFKDRMVELNQGINWIPEHIRDGQFGKWLEGARDWSISRNRYWGTPIPVWRNEAGDIKVFGSIKELEEFFGVKVTDLHRPFIDELTKKDPKTGHTWRRVTDVFDCWFESGAMPFAQVHYPFENKEWFETHFPADFIVEYVGQTRGWFYTLVVLATALFDKIPFKNCICHGIILDEHGKKLSKRLRNYPDPHEMFKLYGADAMRWRMVKEPVMHGGNLLISKDGSDIRDVVRLSIKPIWNAYHFFTLYANADGIKAALGATCSVLGENTNTQHATPNTNIMDRYILAKLKQAVKQIDDSLNHYMIPEACAAVDGFFEVLNNWYIRRNKERFWKAEHDNDKQAAYDTLYTVLHVMCRAAAPLLPFTLEEIFGGLTGSKESIHLQDFPAVSGIADAAELLAGMDLVRDACNAALAVRGKENIRVRQPLQKLTIVADGANNLNNKEYIALIQDEVNVKEVTFSSDISTYATHQLKINFPVLGKRLKDEGKAEKMKEITIAAKQGKWNVVKNRSPLEGEQASRGAQATATSRGGSFEENKTTHHDSASAKGLASAAPPQGGSGILVADEMLRQGEFELTLVPKNPKGAQALSTNDALVVLDLNITDALRKEGLARDIVRLIQEARKQSGLNVSDRIALALEAEGELKKAAETFADYIKEQTLADLLEFSVGKKYNYSVEKEIEGRKITVSLNRIEDR